MRIAALYDIHGNLPALEAVLAEVARAQIDLIVIGGDVFPGPMPRQCLRHLSALDTPVRFIQGNGDRVVRALMAGHEPTEVPERYRDTIRWNVDQLLLEDAEWIASWPLTVSMTTSSVGLIHFCHASK